MAIKTITENPFSDYGNLVTGNRFIGREKEIRQIHNRVLSDNSGNLSVVGIPRIGKSSLVWNALISSKDDLLEEKKAVIEINVGSIDNSRDLFKAMASEVLDTIEEFIEKGQFAFLKQTFQNFSEDISNYEYRSNLYKFLKRTKKTNFQVIYIFEEFDKGGDFLSLSDFQALREIGTRPEYNVRYVTISRRTIQELEAKNGALSRFYAIFDYLNLSVFSDEDVKKYWTRLEDYNITVSDDYISKSYSLVGKHPFLLDVVNYQVFNHFVSNTNCNDLYDLLNDLFSGDNLNLLYHFDEIIDLMKDENLESKLFQSLVGPVFDLDIKSVEKLIKFGIIKNVEIIDKEKVSFIGFSDLPY